MMQINVSAKVRTNFGKGASRTLRREGQTPAILYGPKTEATPLQLDTKSFTKQLITLQRRNAVFNLEIKDGGDQASTRHAMIKEIQKNPIADTLVHTDFYEISLDTPMIFEVPVQFTGKAKGVDLGGEMIVMVDRVALKGLALDIPDSIKIDVTALGIGNEIKVGALTIPAGSVLLEDTDKVCVGVYTARAELEDEEGEEGEEAVAEEAGEGAETAAE